MKIPPAVSGVAATLVGKTFLMLRGTKWVSQLGINSFFWLGDWIILHFVGFGSQESFLHTGHWKI